MKQFQEIVYKHFNNEKDNETQQQFKKQEQWTNSSSATEQTQKKYDDLEFQMLNDKPDALTDLIGRARGITEKNKDKIYKAKRELKVSKKETTGTFLTGTGIYAQQVEEQVQMPDYQPEEQVDHDALLRELTRKGEYDDLAELRRMIKVTGENLDGYSREVCQIKKDVFQAANQFKSQMDFDLTYKLNKLQEPHAKKNQYKSSSGMQVNRYK